MTTCSWRRSVLGLALALGAVLGTPKLTAAQLYAGQGTWVTDDGNVSGTWQGTIDAAGQDLSGDLILTGIPNLTEARIDGTWHPGVIDSATLTAKSQVATLSGTINDPSVAGTFTMPVGGGITGTWQGQIALIPDDLPPTPIVDDPAADNTPNPAQLTPEELAALASIEQAAPSSPTPAPTDPTPTPGGAGP